MAVAQLDREQLERDAKAAGLPTLATVRQVATWLHKHDRTIRRWIRQGRLKVVKTDPHDNGGILISIDALIRMLTHGAS
jgi:excisionase family DNA binding protein